MHLQAAVRAGFIAILGSVVASFPGLTQDVRHIVVNVVNEAGVSATVLEGAHRRVTRIFETIGVAVVCTHTYLADSEAFIVKIVDERAAERIKAPASSVGIALTGSNGGGRSRTSSTIESSSCRTAGVWMSLQCLGPRSRTSSGTCSCRLAATPAEG